MSELLLPARLVIAEAAACRDLLIMHLLSSAGEVLLDGSQVQDVDTAGLQLLLSAAQTARASHRGLRVVRCSAVLRRAVELLNLTDKLGVSGPSAAEDSA